MIEKKFLRMRDKNTSSDTIIFIVRLPTIRRVDAETNTKEGKMVNIKVRLIYRVIHQFKNLDEAKWRRQFYLYSFIN